MEIPNLKVGMSMSEVSELVKQSNLSDSQRNSIFNMINDDADGKITDNVELQKLLSFFNDCKINMKNLIPLDKDANVRKRGTETTISANDYKDVYTESESGRTTYAQITEKFFGIGGTQLSKLHDTDGDGYADKSTTRTADGNLYEDSDLDGRDDYRVINAPAGGTIYEKRDEDGRWILDN